MKSNHLKTILLSIVAISVIGSTVPGYSNNNQQNTDSLSKVIKAEVTKSVPQSKQAEAARLLNSIMDANAVSHKKVKEIKLLPSKELNAATDGSTIVFSEGLWDLLSKDDQKAFVLSHELAHIELNHIPKTTARRVGYSLLQRFLNAKFSNGGSTFWNQVGQVGLGLTELKFSRGAEYGADDLGLSMMHKAGYDPHAAIEVFDLFEKNSPSKTPEFLRSHPLSRSRIERLSEKHSQTFNPEQAPELAPQSEVEQIETQTPQRINIH